MAFASINEKTAGSTTPAEGQILDTDVNQIREVIQLATKDMYTNEVYQKGPQLRLDDSDVGIRFNSTSSKMEFSNDGINWNEIGSGGGFSDPMTTRGDLIVRDATNTTSRLGVGVADQVLTSDGSDVAWADIPMSNEVYLELVAGENVVDGDLCYLKSDGKFWKADADAQTTSDNMLCVATETILADATGTFLQKGKLTTTGLTVGSKYYVSATAGSFTVTAPSTTGQIVRIVGYALSSTILWFDADKTFIEVA